MFSCVTFCASEIMGDHCPIRQSRGPKGTPPRPGSSSSTPAPPILILILSLSRLVLSVHHALSSSAPLPSPLLHCTHPCPSTRRITPLCLPFPIAPQSHRPRLKVPVVGPAQLAVKRFHLSSPCPQSLDTATCCTYPLSSAVPPPASRSRTALLTSSRLSHAFLHS